MTDPYTFSSPLHSQPGMACCLTKPRIRRTRRRKMAESSGSSYTSPEADKHANVSVTA